MELRTVVILLRVASLVVSLTVAGLAWRRRPKPGAVPLTGIMLFVAVWAATSLGATLAGGFRLSLWFERAVFVGSTFVIFWWFVFALEFTGREAYLTRRTWALLLVEPLGYLALVFASDAHDLVWTARPADPVVTTGVEVVARGPAFWLHLTYSYVLVLAGVVFLVGMLYQMRSRAIYRWQGLALLAAVAVPWGANAAFLLDAVPVSVTPTGFAVSGVLLFLAMTRYEFMDLVPVARATVLENVRNGVLVLDEADRVVDANPVARRFLSIDGSVVGRPIDEVFAAAGLDAWPFEGDQAAVAVDREDGRRHYEVRVSAVTDARDRQVGRALLVHDVTAQKRRQRELERQNEQLDRFASLVSHDLRNPLNVASGYLDLARDTGDLDHVRKMRQSHDRMAELIDDVLTLARQGSSVTDAETVQVGDLARRAWESVDTGDARLVVDLDLRTEADPTRLRQAFENLFRNAVEHGSTSNRPEAGDSVEHGGPTVTVRVGTLDDSRGFYVADDGPGIPEDERESVLEDGYTTSDDGTGLGLSIVTSVVEAHGWTVRVTESESGGARFEVAGVTRTDDARAVGASTPG